MSRFLIAPSFGIEYATSTPLPASVRAIVRLLDVARPAERQADLAVGEIVDVARGVDVADVGADRQQHLFRRLQILGRLAVGVLAQIQQHGADHLGRRIQNGHAAILEFRHDRRIVEHAPAVHGRIRHRSLIFATL